VPGNSSRPRRAGRRGVAPRITATCRGLPRHEGEQ